MRYLLSVFTVTLLSLTPLVAQDFPYKLPGAGGSKAKSFADVADLVTTIEPAQAKRGQVVTFKLTIAPKPGCYTYPITPPESQDSRNKVVLPRKGNVIFVGEPRDPDGWKEKPAAESGKTDRYYPNAVTWEFPAVIAPNATPGKQTVILTGSQLQACNASNCFNTNRNSPPSAEVEILDGPTAKVPDQYAKEVNAAIGEVAPAPAPNQVAPPTPLSATPSTGTITKAPISPDQHKANLDSLEAAIAKTPVSVQGGFAGLLLAAVVWGFISLVTPCVFPMIPITVSLFLKQSHQTASSVLKLALIYCLTIILVLGSSAVFLLSVFRKLSVDPVMNIFLGALFIFFAQSLFGMYDISLPNFLLRYTEKKRTGGGTIGTVFGALAFSIVSFTCVAPFLGGFAGLAASGNYSTFELVIAGVVFATAFASPFFVLAMFPSLIKTLPKSGGWLDTVKAVMGFLELAAAFKFFRTAEIRILDRPEFFTYDVVLGAWVGIALVAGLYMLNLFRLPHDEEKPNVGVVRMLIGLVFIGTAFYLLPGLFKTGSNQSQRPNGKVYAWVNAFLLPEPAEPGASDELPWGSDLKAAVDQITKAKASGVPVAKPFIFIDFTGKTCTNCKLNENKVFPLPGVRSLLQQYTLVQMYTDEVPGTFYAKQPTDADRDREAAHNLQFQETMFGTQQLPLYVILDPQADGKVTVVGVYDEGVINDVTRFVEFLKKPLEKK